MLLRYWQVRACTRRHTGYAIRVSAQRALSAVASAIVDDDRHENLGGRRQRAVAARAHAEYQRVFGKLLHRDGAEVPRRDLLPDGKSRQQGALIADTGDPLHQSKRIGDAEYFRFESVTGKSSVDLLTQTERWLGENERESGEFAQRHRFALGERMGWPDGGHHQVAKDWRARDCVAVRWVGDESDLSRAGSQCLHRLVGAAHFHVERDARRLHTKAMQDRRDEALERSLEAADIDRAGLDIPQGGDMRFHARELAHHAFEFFSQDFSGWREHHPLGSAVEDRHA